MGGETEFLRRVEADGYTGWFVPEAVVGHIIRPEQTQEEWILQRAYRYGIGEGCHYAGLPRRLRLRAIVYDTAAALARLLPRSAVRLKIRYKARALDGALDALRNSRKQERTGHGGHPPPAAARKPLGKASNRKQESLPTC